MPYQVLVKVSAEKEIRRLPSSARKRVIAAILALQDDPRPSGVRKLKGRLAESYRLRVGAYRVLYRIDDAQRRVVIFRVRHRREVYR